MSDRVQTRHGVPFRKQPKREAAKFAAGFICECGSPHSYSAYVHAHWDDDLTHSCACGRRHSVFQGVAALLPRRTDGTIVNEGAHIAAKPLESEAT